MFIWGLLGLFAILDKLDDLDEPKPRKTKRCPHGSTSWYICPTCKKERPDWGPFEGEGPYSPYIKG